MRLIDADALERNVLKWMPSDPCGREEKEYPFKEDVVVSLMMEIEEAPTIEVGDLVIEMLQKSNCLGCKHFDEEHTSRICYDCRRAYRDKHEEGGVENE